MLQHYEFDFKYVWLMIVGIIKYCSISVQCILAPENVCVCVCVNGGYQVESDVFYCHERLILWPLLFSLDASSFNCNLYSIDLAKEAGNTQ